MSSKINVDKLYVVNFRGNFSFLKPHTALRDSEIYSQTYLTPSTLIGIEFKLFYNDFDKLEVPQFIKRHKLDYDSHVSQQETVLSEKHNVTFTKSRDGNVSCDSTSIIKRHVLLNPKLYLAFSEEDVATHACFKIIKLGRSEDFMYPDSKITIMTHSEFDKIQGSEFISNPDGDISVGSNRFNEFKIMKGNLITTN